MIRRREVASPCTRRRPALGHDARCLAAFRHVKLRGRRQSERVGPTAGGQKNVRSETEVIATSPLAIRFTDAKKRDRTRSLAKVPLSG
jgi:hypothetical protein